MNRHLYLWPTKKLVLIYVLIICFIIIIFSINQIIEMAKPKPIYSTTKKCDGFYILASDEKTWVCVGKLK
jgi:hypothetical protein